MPQPRQPGTLKEQCVRNISRNMDSYWCEDYLKNWHTLSKSLVYVLGPFEDLPGSLVELIIEELSRTKRLRKHHLHLLLVYHLERLDLKHDIESEIAITPLVNRCKNLRHLGLKCKKLPRKLLNDVFINLRYLQTVDLSLTNVSDQTLEAVACYCDHIKMLNLAHTDVTDIGINTLCFGPRNTNNNTVEVTPIAKSLVRLILYGTVVTIKGLHCALLLMPNLQELNHSALLYALASVGDLDMSETLCADGRDTSLPERLMFNLRHLLSDEYGCSILGILSDARLIEAAVNLCPHIQYIHLSDVTHVQSDSLVPLLELSDVVDLTLNFDEDEEVDFYNHIVPLLIKHGSTLNTLQLRHVRKTNIAVIACLCTSLETLVLESNSYYCQSNPAYVVPVKVQPNFQKLKVVNIYNNETDNMLDHLSNQIPADSLLLLLRCPLLEELELFSQDGLNDELLLDVISSTKFPYLKHVQFNMCNNITISSIWAMMHLRNPLLTLNLKNCREITVNDYNDLRKYARKNKFTLLIVWT